MFYRLYILYTHMFTNDLYMYIYRAMAQKTNFDPGGDPDLWNKGITLMRVWIGTSHFELQLYDTQIHIYI